MSELFDRAERGLAIAASPGQIELVSEGIWSVRSQSGDGVYLLCRSGSRWKCICPDFAAHHRPCKHVVALQVHLGEIAPKVALDQESERRPRPSYRQDWRAYNAAQRSELGVFDAVLAELVAPLEDPAPPKATGRPRLPFADLLFCAVERMYQGLPLRVDHGLNDRLVVDGRISRSPSRNMPSQLLRRPEVAPILTDLIAKIALPLASLESNFAIDSSGFRTTSFGDYCREKYGARVHNTWLKAHVIIGTATHVIPCVKVTDGHAADVLHLPWLVQKTAEAGFVLKEVYADKGYLSGENAGAIGAIGADPYIMFKATSRGRTKHQDVRTPFWKQMWHLYQSNPGLYLAHYHKRSNVESVFAAIKKKLGETIRSKDPVAQQNELLCKVLAYNITVLIHEAFEHGIPVPGTDSAAPREPQTRDESDSGETRPKVASLVNDHASWENN